MPVTPPRYLRATGSTSIPSSLVFVDTEAYRTPHKSGQGELQTFRLGVAISYRRVKGKWACRDVIRFADPLDFWEWLGSKVTFNRPCWVFSHNLGYDVTLLRLWEQLDIGVFSLTHPCKTCGQLLRGDCKQHTPFLGTCVTTDPPSIICVRCNRGIIKFVDTMNYYKCSVEQLGEQIALPKLVQPNEGASESVWYDYCQRDVEIIAKSICGFMDSWVKNNSGHWATTSAGLAWAAFRRTLQDKRILINHDAAHTSLERAAYYGGQAEAYYLGKYVGDLTLHDVRSLYPSVMLSQYYPVKFLRFGREKTPGEIWRRLQYQRAVAWVKVRTEGSGYPKRLEGKLCFPVGEYWTCLASPELQRACERDEIVRIGKIAWYQAMPILRPFVEKWYELRCKAERDGLLCDALLYKLILNSLSGKFAQHSIRWKDRPGHPPQRRWGQWLHYDNTEKTLRQFRSIAGHVQEMIEGGEGRDAIPVISAHITSHGRELMRGLRELLPGQSCLYQDTDSLLTTLDGSFQLANRGLVGLDRIGTLRIVRGCQSCYIHSVKDYELDDEAKISGVKANAEKVGNGVFRQDSWQSLADVLAGEPQEHIRVTPIMLRLGRDYRARLPGADGWTLPIRLAEGDSLPF